MAGRKKKKKAKVADVAASVIEKALRERYPSPQWAFFTEVAPSTGWNRKQRYADAVAMDTWPSSGLEIHGFEIKVSRGDWLRELKDPSKADALARYCDRWWIAAPKGLVQPEELPKTWGLYEYSDGKLRAKVKGALIEAEPVNRGLVAMLIRRGAEAIERERRKWVPAADVEAMIVTRVASRLKDEARYAQDDYSRLKSDHEDLVERVAEFEEKSGVHVRNWGFHVDRDVLKAAVEAKKDGDQVQFQVKHAGRTLTEAIRKLEMALKHAKGLDAALAELSQSTGEAADVVVSGITRDLFEEIGNGPEE